MYVVCRVCWCWKTGELMVALCLFWAQALAQWARDQMLGHCMAAAERIAVQAE